MPAILIVLFGVYCFVLGMFWIYMLISEGGVVLPYFGKKQFRDNLSKEEWIITIWVSIFWPFLFIYKLFFKWGKPILKFFWDIIVFIFDFITFPFKKLINLFTKNEEPIKYRIAKWIVKKYKL